MAIQKNYAPFSIGVTEARSELMKVIEASNNQTIALMHQNKIKAYIVPVSLYEDMIDALEESKSKK